MKKKIIIFCTVIIFLLVCVLVTGVIIYNSEWADERYKTYHGTAETQFSYEPGNEYNSGAGGYEIVDESNKCYIDYLLECEITDGKLIFSIIDTHGNRPNENKESYTVVYQEEISESGSYVYNLSDLEDGTYIFQVRAENEEVFAKGKLVSRYYYSNWEYLMRRLGLMRD